MREIQLGSHTIQTHGARLARKHTYDWLVLIFLAAVVLALHYAPPFNRFVGKDMMTGVRYPVKQSTVPAWTVPIISILCPVAVFVSLYIARRDVYDLHHATLGVIFAVLITAALTNVIKITVGRPRPDFFWRCFPDGRQLYDKVTGGVICHGEKSFLTDGRKSFPSGHTSWSFAGLGFLSLYLSGKIKAFDRQGHIAKLCIVVLPLLLASLVGISRIDDYRHHWEDVFVGGLIGYGMAVVCYLHFFPPPHHHQGWGPYVYFHMLEELEAGNYNSGNAQNQQPAGVSCNSNNAQNQQRADEHHIGVTGRNQQPAGGNCNSNNAQNQQPAGGNCNSNNVENQQPAGGNWNSNNAQNQQPAGEHHIGVTGQNHSRTSRNDLEFGRA